MLKDNNNILTNEVPVDLLKWWRGVVEHTARIHYDELEKFV